jgi:hypothetical protein
MAPKKFVSISARAASTAPAASDVSFGGCQRC